MDGAQQPLRTWEKLYWGVFVTALAGLLFSRLYRTEKPEPKVSVLHAIISWSRHSAIIRANVLVALCAAQQ